jgi:aspartyl-tRNA(Asn)/glutamyl-tRNA(Gln) amidotransferase subunit B
VVQETLGWDETNQRTYSQRSKEEAHDYRYFPEPDLPPLVVEQDWVECIRLTIPELPRVRAQRLQKMYDLSRSEANNLSAEREVAQFFESCAGALKSAQPRTAALWILGEVFAWLNQSEKTFDEITLTPLLLAELLDQVQLGVVNQNSAKQVLAEMMQTGQSAQQIITDRGLGQVSDDAFIRGLVAKVISESPVELASYLAGKETLSNWFFGQVMKTAGGKANPAVLKGELEKQLQAAKDS